MIINQMTSSLLNKIALIGAGGHTRSLMALLKQLRPHLSGIYDDSFDPQFNEIIGGLQVLGPISMIPDNQNILISVGDIQRRSEWLKQFQNRIYSQNLIAETAVLHDIALGLGNQIFSRVVINMNASIGDFNLINTGAIIEHECKIGFNNHISVGSILCGRVTIGDHCMIGAGTVVNDKVKITNHVTVGSNSTVTSDITVPGVYVGSPCKRIK